MDKKLFLLLFGLGRKSEAFGAASKLVAKYSYPFFYVVYVLGFCLCLYIDKWLLITYLVIPFAVYLVNNTLRSALKKARPFQELDIEPLIEHKGSPSCPSNHAACAVVIALAFINVIGAYAVPTLTLGSYILIVCALITGLSRVVCGIHYPKDIAVGWLIGCIGWFVLYAVIQIILKMLI